MRQSLLEQQAATIYQYKLVRRKVIRPELVQSHILIAVILLAFQLLMYRMDGLFSWLLGFAIVQVIHLVILLLAFIRVDDAVDRRWVWGITPPWFGFKPANDIRLALYRRVHRHLFWIGLCAVAVMYPWIQPSLLISILCWHLWLIVPRMLLSLAFRKQRKDGILRLQKNEASYYHQ
ncbi:MULTISPECIES: transposase [Paenibacillus]|uniref:transposase n=1 Tax=Paenibacillus TaxID=44249 RepID=UPI00190FCF8A|nr:MULTISPECIES: transposase [Paenibacillus]MCK9859190.1 transposase [Paenibacillus sp. ATY16]